MIPKTERVDLDEEVRRMVWAFPMGDSRQAAVRDLADRIKDRLCASRAMAEIIQQAMWEAQAEAAERRLMARCPRCGLVWGIERKHIKELPDVK